MESSSGRYGHAEGRWSGLGPYYAMFPVPFARDVVNKCCPERGGVLDPFCGRGTAPFAAQAANKRSMGIDSNPVAWVFAKGKTDPVKRMGYVLAKLEHVRKASRKRDEVPQNEFQEWAWHPRVLRFLRAARRTLDWQNCRTDRTLMAFILASLHSKLGDGISNQLQKARALGPDYSVRWWKERKMRPPALCPVAYFTHRIEWRYKHGIVRGTNGPAKILRGNAQTVLRRRGNEKFDLLFTSPPYLNITSYLHDSWMRLWMLKEGGALPNWKKDKAVHHAETYESMMKEVFGQCQKMLKKGGNVWVRTDGRKLTKTVTLETLAGLWGENCLYFRADIPARTQTPHCGNKALNPAGEIDFLISRSPGLARHFRFRKYLRNKSLLAI